ncbi:1-acylglycerol-3-phosphate O-acyltransferase [Nocardia thailandica]
MSTGAAPVAAVFDVVGTVVDDIPRRGPLRRLFRRGDPRAAILLGGFHRARSAADYARFLQATRAAVAGTSPEELDTLGRGVFAGGVYGRLFPEAWELVRTHQRAGHAVVLVSELTEAQVRPIAERLGVDRVVCTALAEADDALTGDPLGPPLWGQAKADAVRAYARAEGLDIGFAYSASPADLPLLELADRATVIGDDPVLTRAAAERGWATARFRPRPAPGAGDRLRTVAGFAALLAGALFGVARKAPTRRRRAMADGLMHDATAATLRTLDVTVRVIGAEHARAPRPAVFLFNHQSQFDVIIVPYVLGGGVTAIAKKELTRNPVFGPLMRFVGVTFIDRADSASARAALEPVVSTLRDGLSVAVAPEGTRSYTPGPGPFKKGAFHIARQAGVPVIPIVIRNAGEIAWRDSPVARPGVVDVAVLAPIDVSAWDPAELDERVEEVRRLYEDTLLDWPAS